MNVQISVIVTNSLGLVVQSIVSLMSLIRGQLDKCFMTLLLKTLIFLLKKYEMLLLHCKSFSPFSQKKKK